MLCLHCRLQVGMNKKHSKHPSPSPCRFLDILYCLKDGRCDSYLFFGLFGFFYFFLFTLLGKFTLQRALKEFGSCSTQRLGYSLWLRKSLNCDAGMERCNRGMFTIGMLLKAWGTCDSPCILKRFKLHLHSLEISIRRGDCKTDNSFKHEISYIFACCIVWVSRN